MYTIDAKLHVRAQPRRPSGCRGDARRAVRSGCGGRRRCGIARAAARHRQRHLLGGCLRGREWLRFGGDGGATGAADGVHPDLWSLATAHVLGSIWADGEEIHAQSPECPVSPWAGDSDTHIDQSWPAEFLSLPKPGADVRLGRALNRARRCACERRPRSVSSAVAATRSDSQKRSGWMGTSCWCDLEAIPPS